MSQIADQPQVTTPPHHNPHPAPLAKAKPPAPDSAVLFTRARELLPTIATGASERERTRTLPFAQARAVAEAGLLTFRIPKAYGGPGGSVRDVMRFIVSLASVDSNLAQALRPNFGLIDGLLAARDEAQRQRWFPRMLAGHIFGNGGVERGGAHGSVAARLVRDGDHFRVNGTKYYSTGALFADWVTSIALNEDGKETSFVLPRERAGMHLDDDFDAIGQRLTASGTTRFVDTLVHADEVRPGLFSRDQRNPVTPMFQLYLGAVEAGIARNALDDAVRFAQTKARPIKHSGATASVDEPYVRETVGRIAAQAYTAEAVVLRAAEAIDAAWADQLSNDALTAASIEVAQAQYVAAESAMRAAEWAFDVGGASATDRAHNLDRHWRNARTVANHNPRQWKAAVTGAWLLKGEQPPTSGLF
ncbi:acyl-CoA dehydrogenase family protein [Xylophilus sp. GOD-11R]|uniref:acyl-CoA dehydrogenase family protein n=1 Tax=Xylophilus sp. GOD-11R TaxID=3089814 RepID=UPI00298CA143|nr:acyl-CoA dehydrogenase family protein [Xylophilus sp. GOD-11R]WPB58853.1 acyl-CoA dehydrogenase family protein [Xylophilus sp. GOD-11R]